MNRFLPVCWFVSLLALSGALAQNPQTARLKQELAAAKTDTSRVLLLADISSSYRYSKPDSSLAYAQRGLELAEKIRFAKGEGRCLARLGHNIMERGNLPLALRHCLKAQHLNEQKRDWTGLAQTLNVLGLIHNILGSYPQARSYFFQGMAIYEQEKLDADAELTAILYNIGTTYLTQSQLDSASYFLQKSYQLANHSPTIQRSTRGNPLTYILRDLGNLQARLGHPAQALAWYRTAIRVCEAENDQRSLSRTFLSLAEVYRTRNQPDSSAFFAREALATSQALSMLSILQSSTLLSNSFKSQRQPDSALKYLEIAVAARDSLFSQRRIQELQEINFDEQRRTRRAEAERERFESQVKIYALLAGVLVLLAGAIFLWRTNRRQQRANALLHRQKQEIEQQRATAEAALAELKTTQAQLIQSEKMASLGELTAGIAHEIQNPLNFVNNFSEVSAELVEELEEEHRKPSQDADLKGELLHDLKQNLAKITQHGQRASSIVRGMLDHARASTGERQPTDLNALADEALRLSYHGLRAKASGFNAALSTDLDERLGQVDVLPQDLSRVLLNLFNNAFYAVQEKQKTAGGAFRPEVKLSTKRLGNAVEIRIRDNGGGIPEAVRAKIFQPFFTTKPTGEGTGLGLSLSYDIITKGHGGTLAVETAEGEFTEFVVTLPTAARLAVPSGS